MSDTATELNLVVAIATAGRRDTLTDTIHQLAHQKRLPSLVVVCPAQPADCDEDAMRGLPFAVRVVHGPRGLTSQRNTILEAVPEADVFVFLDDDFYPQRDFLEQAERLFLERPEVVGVTGHVLADGKLGVGISHHEALTILEATDRTYDPKQSHASSEVYNLYGCNMLVRARPVFDHYLRFDNKLPLYGWLEDVDFTRRLARHGLLLEDHRLCGVHLATKRGRVAGVRFGYSQVANPLYLMWKGTMAPSRALAQTSRNLARNLQRSFVGTEPWIDRRGRLKGNFVAFAHLLTGRLRPENVITLT